MCSLESKKEKVMREIEREHAEILAKLDRILELLQPVDPPIDPPIAPPPVGTPDTHYILDSSDERYTIQGLRKDFYIPPAELPSIKLFTPARPTGPVVFADSDDIDTTTAVANAIAATQIEDVLNAFTALQNSDPVQDYRWYDNDTHGRRRWPYETMLHLKAASLGHYESIEWLKEMIRGDETNGPRYSPYKIANSLIALGPLTGGLIATGRRMDQIYGYGYEGMWTTVPFTLLYLWYQFTGEDLISNIPCFKYLASTFAHRYKDYHEHVGIAQRASFLVNNLLGEKHAYDTSGLGEWPRLPESFMGEPVNIPKNVFFWNPGDHTVSRYEDGTELDISAPANSAARSEYYPRCFGYMRNGKGLPFMLNFKGGINPRGTSGLYLNAFVTGTDEEIQYWAFDTTYSNEKTRPRNPLEMTEVLNPPPYFEGGQKCTLTYPLLHNRRHPVLRNEHPKNCITTFIWKNPKELTIRDEILFTVDHPVTLSFTFTGDVPKFFSDSLGGVFEFDWGHIAFNGSIVSHKINTQQTGQRDTPDRDECYNPNNYAIVDGQLFVEFEPSQHHLIFTEIVFND